jgi:hypothetical protein
MARAEIDDYLGKPFGARGSTTQTGAIVRSAGGTERDRKHVEARVRPDSESSPERANHLSEASAP